jgi:hypothetical protein
VTVSLESWIDKPEIIMTNLVAIAEYRREVELLSKAYKIAVYLLGVDVDTTKVFLN